MSFVTSTIVGLTDPGLVREHNEDSFAICYPRTGQVLPNIGTLTLPRDSNSLLLAVSDGMGGASAGEVASRLTVETIMRELPRLPAVLSPYCRLEAAIEAANYAVWREQQSKPALRGMGATVTAVLVEQGWAYIAEVGDSRAYLIRRRQIMQLTTDQTMIQAMIDAGSITPEVAERSAHRNMLLQAMGRQQHLQVACRAIELRTEDAFLLCSDGLSGKMKAIEMCAVVEQAGSLEEAAHELIAIAKERGGDDNITVILAKLEGKGLKQQTQTGGLPPYIRIISSFDPKHQATARTLRQIRSASFDDWVAMAFVDYFVQTPEQRDALMNLGYYGDYIVFRRGDSLVFQGDRPPETNFHYWLVSGCYRIERQMPDGSNQSEAIVVPPTDMRLDEDLQSGYFNVPIRRQFFMASVSMLENSNQPSTIWCEDDENIAIRVPLPIYERVASILGSRFLSNVRHT